MSIGKLWMLVHVYYMICWQCDIRFMEIFRGAQEGWFVLENRNIWYGSYIQIMQCQYKLCSQLTLSLHLVYIANATCRM